MQIFCLKIDFKSAVVTLEGKEIRNNQIDQAKDIIITIYKDLSFKFDKNPNDPDDLTYETGKIKISSNGEFTFLISQMCIQNQNNQCDSMCIKDSTCDNTAGCPLIGIKQIACCCSENNASDTKFEFSWAFPNDVKNPNHDDNSFIKYGEDSFVFYGRQKSDVVIGLFNQIDKTNQNSVFFGIVNRDNKNTIEGVNFGDESDRNEWGVVVSVEGKVEGSNQGLNFFFLDVTGQPSQIFSYKVYNRNYPENALVYTKRSIEEVQELKINIIKPAEYPDTKPIQKPRINIIKPTEYPETMPDEYPETMPAEYPETMPDEYPETVSAEYPETKSVQIAKTKPYQDPLSPNQANHKYYEQRKIRQDKNLTGWEFEMHRHNAFIAKRNKLTMLYEKSKLLGSGCKPS